jgi:hypothetical protein
MGDFDIPALQGVHCSPFCAPLLCYVDDLVRPRRVDLVGPHIGGCHSSLSDCPWGASMFSQNDWRAGENLNEIYLVMVTP